MLERNNATAREIVANIHPDAFCAISGRAYQIRRRLENASSGRELCLSSHHLTPEEAWYFAATRLLSEEAARMSAESNKDAVLERSPSAYCAVVRCGYFQIQRPRTRSDKRSVLKYMPLSGRFSSEYFAWQDAAQSLVNSAPRTDLDIAQRETLNAQAKPSFPAPFSPTNSVASREGQNSGSSI